MHLISTGREIIKVLLTRWSVYLFCLLLSVIINNIFTEETYISNEIFPNSVKRKILFTLHC